MRRDMLLLSDDRTLIGLVNMLKHLDLDSEGGAAALSEGCLPR
jgi:hypothetical protein